MVDILHRVGIKSSPDEVYEALTSREGLAAWWTSDTQGESKVGGALKFRFSSGGSEIGGFDMKVLELQPAKRVAVASGRRTPGVDRHQDKFRSQAIRRLIHRPLQAPGLEGAGRIHAPLQHQVGRLSDEPEVARGNPERQPQPERHQYQRRRAGLRRRTSWAEGMPEAFRRSSLISVVAASWLEYGRAPGKSEGPRSDRLR